MLAGLGPGRASNGELQKKVGGGVCKCAVEQTARRAEARFTKRIPDEETMQNT